LQTFNESHEPEYRRRINENARQQQEQYSKTQNEYNHTTHQYAIVRAIYVAYNE